MVPAKAALHVELHIVPRGTIQMKHGTRDPHGPPLRITLEEMGHKQPKTPVTTDNSTAHGLIHQLLIPKASKSMDMRCHWLKCRVTMAPLLKCSSFLFPS